MMTFSPSPLRIPRFTFRRSLIAIGLVMLFAGIFMLSLFQARHLLAGPTVTIDNVENNRIESESQVV